MFVCLFRPTERELSESIFFHLYRFEAVASCCWKAFLANEKSVPGRRLLTISAHFLTVASSKASLTAVSNLPWIFSVEIWSTSLVSCSAFSASNAGDLVGSRSSKESIIIIILLLRLWCQRLSVEGSHKGGYPLDKGTVRSHQNGRQETGWSYTSPMGQRKYIAWDFTAIHTCAASYLHLSSWVPGGAAEHAAN